MLRTAQKIKTKITPPPPPHRGMEVLWVTNSKVREISITVDKWIHFFNHREHTGKDTDYAVYKEAVALNAATNEVRKSKRKFEHKLAQHIKSNSKRFYAYIRSKQNVREKVGPLEDNAGNIITQGSFIAEELNLHFSSVVTREDTSSLPLPETKLSGPEGERLGQLVVTPELVATKLTI